MWPWSHRSAVVVSGLLVCVLVGALIAVSATTSWPRDSLEPWVFGGAVLIALIPMLMLLLDFTAERRAKLGIARVFTIDFSSAADGRDGSLQSQTITPNIVGAGVQVADSGSERMQSALRSATETDVIVLDLGSGDSWWMTRLLVLTAGASRMGRPAAIAFTSREGSRRGVFLGWVAPTSLLDQIVRRDPELRFVYWYAQRAWIGQFALVGQVPNWSSWEPPPPNLEIRHHAATQPTHPARAPAVQPTNTDQLPSDLGPEMLLASELTHLEPPAHGISAGDLVAMAGAVLHRDAIELNDPPERQIEVALGSEEGFVGVLRNGEYIGLARVDIIVRDLLRSVTSVLAAR